MEDGATILGERYRDTISGFEGNAVSAHEYLYGCRRITLETLGKDGDKLVVLTFDEPALIPTTAEASVSVVDYQKTKKEKKRRTGGPHDPDSVIDRHGEG